MKRRSFLLSIALITTTAMADVYDESLPDLTFDVFNFGTGGRTTGVVQTFNIPTSGWAPEIQIVARGGDGGRAKASAAVGQDQSANGGGGTVMSGTFRVSPTLADSLKPGGQLRWVVGNAGANQTNTNLIAAGGGGGGSGVLYKAPVDGAEWELLLVAGGGGGGAASTSATQTFADRGDNANTGINGDDSGSGTKGGVDGGAGQWWINKAGGGAGYLGEGDDTNSGKRWINGGAGGEGEESGVNGGFGLGGGGGSFRRSPAHQGGGGGGGGYSGGAAGFDDPPGNGNRSPEGGGAGSYVSDWALTSGGNTRNGSQENGFVQIQYRPGPPDASNSLTGPTITASPAGNLTFYDFESANLPAVTATDVYGNDIPGDQITTTSNVQAGVPGNYFVRFTATDDFGKSTTLQNSITIVPANKPTFSIAGNISVNENSGTYTDSDFVTNFNANDPGQSLKDYLITNDNNGLFVSQPALGNSGLLIFVPKADTFGSATVSIVAVDNFDDPNNGRSDPVTFTITVNQVFDPPTFTVQNSVTVARDAGAQSFSNFITNFNANDPNQSLDRYEVSTDSPELFSVQPSIDNSGNLTFTPDGLIFATATVTVTAFDEGPSNNSSQQTFTLVITDVQPEASFTVGKTLVLPGQSIQFTDNSSDATSWAWDFDNDGTTDSTAQNPTHAFTAPGTYSVSLTATNSAGGDTKTVADLVRVVPFGFVNGDMSSTNLVDSLGSFNLLGTGWYGKFADDGTNTRIDWSLGQTVGNPGVLTHTRTSGTATRLGQFFANNLNGNNWALSFEIGDVENAGSFVHMRLYAGTLAENPSGTVLRNDYGAPDGRLVDSNGWTLLLAESDVSANGTVTFNIDEDLSQFDVMAIQFRAQGGDVGTTYDNFQFIQQAQLQAMDDSLAVGHIDSLSGTLLGNDTGAATNAPLAITRVEDAPVGMGVTIDFASGGEVTVQADGTFQFETNGAYDFLGGGQSANESFNYIIGEGDNASTATVTITITNAPDPVRDVALDNAEIPENNTAVGAVTAFDPDGDQLRFQISGGADQEFFEIDSTTGDLSFKIAPDFENPTDADGDNIYEISIYVAEIENFSGTTDSSFGHFTITVNDVPETGLEIFRDQYGMALDGSDDGADFSGNGIANILYFAFGLGDPTMAEIDRSRLPFTGEGATSDTLTFCYTRPSVGDSRLRISVLTSTDLSSWESPFDLFATHVPISTVITDLGDGYEKVKLTFATTSGNERFYRLAVSEARVSE